MNKMLPNTDMIIKFVQFSFILTVFIGRPAWGFADVNTPPQVFHNRQWVLTENEKVGAVVDRLRIQDGQNDPVTISLSSASSNILNDIPNGYKHFTIDADNRILIRKSLQGLAGKSFMVGIKISDGKITTRSDVKVTVTTPNQPSLYTRTFGTSYMPRHPTPRVVANIPSTPTFDPRRGPPMINLEPGSVLEVNSTADVGFFVDQIKVHDFSNTLVKLKIHPRGLLHISSDGKITVAENLQDKVGRYKMTIIAANQFSRISDEFELHVLGPGFSKEDSFEDVGPKQEIPMYKKNHDDGRPKHTHPRDKSPGIVIEKTDSQEGISSPNVSTGNQNIIIILIVVCAILLMLLIGFIIFYRRKRNKRRSKSKSLSVEYRHKQASMDSNDDENPDSSIIRDFLHVVGFRKRAESNKYVETKNSRNLGKGNSYKYQQEIPLADKWEFPRHKLRFVDILGEGCFGQVWRSEAQLQEGETTLVAVKTLKESSGPEEKRDLLQEMKVYKSLAKHPNVVSFLGCCTEKDPLFMMIEYMPGGTLQNYLRNSRTSCSYNNLHGPSGSLTPRDLTIFALQIAKGMDFLSKNFIIHRDLAARNVLVGDGKVCKVADFGFARDVANNHVYERKSDGRLPIRWMAPESLFDNIFTSQSDVWSFGVLLWEIVTLGSTPYPGKSASEVASSVKSGFRLEKPPHCHREIYNIMYYCWDANPKERLTFSELIKDLDALISKEVDYIALDNFPDRDYYNFNTSSASGELL